MTWLDYMRREFGTDRWIITEDGLLTPALRAEGYDRAIAARIAQMHWNRYSMIFAERLVTIVEA